MKYLLSFLFILVVQFQTVAQTQLHTFTLPDIDDLGELVLADKLMEAYFGIPMNKYVGNLGNYTNLGGGMTVGMLFGRSKFRVGFDMSIYFNGKKAPFVIDSPRPQHESIPSLFFGLSATTDLLETPKGSLNIQGNLSYVQMNVTEKIEDEWDKFSGFSPGLRLNYIHKFWKSKAKWYYGAPSVVSNALQLHLGLSPTFMSDKQGNGLNIDFGIGYRMIVQQIKAYKMKEEKEIYRL